MCADGRVILFSLAQCCAGCVCCSVMVEGSLLYQPEHGGQYLEHLLVVLVPHGGTQIDDTFLYIFVAGNGFQGRENKRGYEEEIEEMGWGKKTKRNSGDKNSDLLNLLKFYNYKF